MGQTEKITTALNNDLENILSFDEDYQKFTYSRVITCYYLLMLKRDPSNSSLMAFRNITFNQKCIKFAAMLFEDLFGYFMDNPTQWKELIGLIDKYSEEDLVEYISSTPFFDEPVEEIPTCITNFVDSILKITENDSILQINTNKGEFASNIAKMHPTNTIVAYDEKYNYLNCAAIYASASKLNNIVFLDDYSEDKYDKVFVNNLINPSLREMVHYGDYYLSDKLKELRNISNEWCACGLALSSLTSDGKAIALMNAGQLSVKETKKARELLCESGLIEGVIMLPDKMYEDTWLNPFIVIFGDNNKSVKLFDASKKYQVDRVKGKKIHILTDEIINEILNDYANENNVQIVGKDLLRKNDYNLNPLRYAMSDENESSIELGEIIKSVKRGATLTASQMDQLISEDKSQIKCILPSSLTRGIIDSHKYFHGEIKKTNKNEASYGNLLINKSGYPFKVAISNDHYYVVGNLYILDLDNTKVSTEYVRCFLLSQRGQDELKKYSVGHTTPIISVENLHKIRIPVFDDEKQNNLNNRCKDIVKEIDEGFKQITNCEKEITCLFD